MIIRKGFIVLMLLFMVMAGAFAQGNSGNTPGGGPPSPNPGNGNNDPCPGNSNRPGCVNGEPVVPIDEQIWMGILLASSLGVFGLYHKSRSSQS
jgi:hypothetical protein